MAGLKVGASTLLVLVHRLRPAVQPDNTLLFNLVQKYQSVYGRRDIPLSLFLFLKPCALTVKIWLGDSAFTETRNVFR